MLVYVKLYSTLVKYADGPGIPSARELPGGETIADLIRGLGIGDDEVVLASVNCQLVDRDCVLKDGDEVSLFGPVAGGGFGQVKPRRNR